MPIDNGDFIFAVGIEDTFVTQTERGERPLDEYHLTQHYEFWQEDLERVRKSGARMVRYGIPWYKVEPREGEFDWEWVDNVMDYFRRHPDLIPILDLMHYGTPHWLTFEFANGRYPQCVSNYARKVAERYGDVVQYFTPLNEPYVNAEFCGLNGVWPPYLKGMDGFYRLMIQLCKGIICTVNAIKDVLPDARFVHVEATKKYITQEERLKQEAELWNENRFVMWELIQGSIHGAHPLYDFMLQYGVSPETLEWFIQHKIEVDIVGLNYYPQFSVHEVKRDHKGFITYPHVLGTEHDLADIIQEVYRRYQRPIMITETSFRGSEQERIEWFHAAYAQLIKLRKEGIPIVGLTWFPFLDLVDWGYRTSGKPVEDEILPFGLYTLKMNNGKLERIRNRVADAFEKLIKDHRNDVMK